MAWHEKFRKVVERHAAMIEGSGMQEDVALRIFESSALGSIAVVRDWYMLCVPSEDTTDGPVTQKT